MGSIVWGPEIAEVFDATYPDLFDVSLLVELAGNGAALELAIGTGRVALALSERGVEVHGIELSPHMVEQLQRKPGAERIAVTIGDMTTTRLDRTFTLVYLVANTLMNVTTLDDQLAVFENAAAHLDAGGCFVLELIVPQLQRVPPGERGWVFTCEPDHVGIETFDDVVEQIAWSHHWIEAHGGLVHHAAPYRYVWPAELELMGRLAGFRLRDRWADWDRSPFATGSRSQVAVFEKR